MSELAKENGTLGQVVDTLKGKLREEQTAHSHTQDMLADRDCAVKGLQLDAQRLSLALQSCEREKLEAEQLICELHSTIKQMASSIQGRDRKIAELQREVQAQHERVQERALDAADSAIQTQSRALVDAAAREQQLCADLRSQQAQHDDALQRLRAELQQLEAARAQQVQACLAEQTSLKKRLEVAMALPKTDAALRSALDAAVSRASKLQHALRLESERCSKANQVVEQWSMLRLQQMQQLREAEEAVQSARFECDALRRVAAESKVDARKKVAAALLAASSSSLSLSSSAAAAASRNSMKSAGKGGGNDHVQSVIALLQAEIDEERALARDAQSRCAIAESEETRCRRQLLQLQSAVSGSISRDSQQYEGIAQCEQARSTLQAMLDECAANNASLQQQLLQLKAELVALVNM